MSATTVTRVGETSHHHDGGAAAEALKELERERHLEAMELQSRRAHLYAGGRILLASLFIVSAAAKGSHFHDTVLAMGRAGITDAAMLLPLALLIELLGGVALAAGLKVRPVATALVAYLGLLTLVVHGDLSDAAQRAQALTNVALAGALLMLVGHGAGSPSVDRWLARRARSPRV